MRVVVQNMEKLGISFSDPSNSVCVTLVCVLHNLGVCFVLMVSICVYFDVFFCLCVLLVAKLGWEEGGCPCPLSLWDCFAHPDMVQGAQDQLDWCINPLTLQH